MFDSIQAKDSLRNLLWEEGKVHTVVEGPYRYRVVAHCSALGRQKALFANGEHPYFCYVELLAGNGQWIQKGAGCVPVLPDGRLLMVVEQRPAQRDGDASTMMRINNTFIDLRDFGPHSSLEFPGGAVSPGEGLKMGALRELQEETGIEGQSARYYSRRHPVYPFGSDLLLRQYVGVAFLSGLSFKDRVENDGGLNVFALTEEEVQRNIYLGRICSVQAALLQWSFYKEVQEARKDGALEMRLLDMGYMDVENVKITK